MVYSVFWTAAIFVTYTYLGYPALIWLLSRCRPQQTTPAVDFVREWPSLAVVVPVYNELQNIPPKLANLRNLEYPRDRLQLVFVSDGSIDGSAERLAREQDVNLIACFDRQGKAHALNTALAQISADVVVFTDIRQQIEAKALLYLVARLLEPDIGAVSGELIHFDPLTNTGRDVGLYWRYEKWIRKAESRFFSILGATGALYAIRRRDYVPLAPDTLLDDFEIPIRILKQGYRLVLESNALVYDTTQERIKGEKARKIRTLTGNFQAFHRNPWLFSPRNNPVFFQFLSHKVFRLMVPYALVLLLASSLVLGEHSFYRTVALVQVLFYGCGVAGLWRPDLFRHRLFSFAGVFVELNGAAVLALRNYLGGRFDSRWEKT